MRRVLRAANSVTFVNAILKVKALRCVITVISPGNSEGRVVSRATLTSNIQVSYPSFVMDSPILIPTSFVKDWDFLNGEKIKCIAKSDEKYTSITLGNLRFLDSYQFMWASLEVLADNLASDGDINNFKCLQGAELLLRKGVYPYDYMKFRSI